MAKVSGRPNWTVGAAAWFACDLSVSASSAPLALPQMPDGMYGFEVSGGLTRRSLEQILRKIPSRVYELICHGEGDADTRTRYNHWGYRWAEELEALTAPETRMVLKEEGIVLTSFARASGSRG
jgi:predicted glycoside hydrolase/deacetylase ChbG (UPF0249 family)